MTTQTFWARHERRIAAGLLLALAVITLALQSYNVGFWAFRHGWTSSHTLAIISRATPENNFLGYSMRMMLEDGTVHLEYFDRYPVFFSALTRPVMMISDHMPTQLYIMRLYFNLFYLGAMFFGYRLARLFFESRYVSVAVVAFAFSSYYLLYYRDMTHYHEPVAMNFLLLSYAIARYKLGRGGRRMLYGAVVFATLTAFGYTMLFLILTWGVVDAVGALLNRERPLLARVGDVFRLDAFWAGVTATALTVTAITYNVLTEARLRGVSVRETSVVDSVMRRLPWVEQVVVEVAREQAATSDLIGWLQFFVVQYERVIRWALPLKTGTDAGVRFVYGMTPMDVRWWIVGVGLVLTAWLVRFIVVQRPPYRQIALITAFGAFPLLFGLINLTGVHDYATMFGMGFGVMLWVSLIRPIAGRGWLVVAALAIGFGLFSASAWKVRTDQQAEQVGGAPYTYDFQRMRELLPDEDRVIYLDNRRSRPECFVRDWQCFALGYYLEGWTLTAFYNEATSPDYVLSRREYFIDQPFVDSGESLTLLPRSLAPQNEVAHLLPTADGVPRTAPDDDAAVFRYGESLRVGAWALDDVQVEACERVVIESWWQTEQALTDTYNMQLVMVTPDGGSAGEANAPLGVVGTAIWEPSRWTLDAHVLTVPCDTPDGEYPLIMGVYHPDTLEPLPAFDGDGNALGNQAYLTTLFVGTN